MTDIDNDMNDRCVFVYLVRRIKLRLPEFLVLLRSQLSFNTSVPITKRFKSKVIKAVMAISVLNMKRYGCNSISPGAYDWHVSFG